MPEIYVVTANNPAVRRSVDKSVLRAPYAWGLRSGKSNDNRWKNAKVGDTILFKFDGAYRVSTHIVSKKKDNDFATKTWGTIKWDISYELVLMLAPPTTIEVPVTSELSIIMGSRHVGLQRLPLERVELAYAHFGGKQKFLKAFGIGT